MEIRPIKQGQTAELLCEKESTFSQIITGKRPVSMRMVKCWLFGYGGLKVSFQTYLLRNVVHVLIAYFRQKFNSNQAYFYFAKIVFT